MAAIVTIPAEETTRPASDAHRPLGEPASGAGSPPAGKLRDPPAAEPNALEPTIYRFVLKHSVPQQLILLALTLISFPFLYLSLELPKTIINRAIGSKQFPQTMLGQELDQISYLLLLCGFSCCLSLSMAGSNSTSIH